jgi:hypothetical protein
MVIRRLSRLKGQSAPTIGITLPFVVPLEENGRAILDQGDRDGDYRLAG